MPDPGQHAGDGGKRGSIAMLTKLRRVLDRGLTETAALWAPLRRAYALIWQAATVLSNAAGLSAPEVRAAYLRVRRRIGLVKRHCGVLEGALTRFLKVTRSYAPGLFHCYAHADIPRTNNGLEQCFGQYRHHERRTTGRKRGTPSTVLRGPVRLLTSVASRIQRWSAMDLAPTRIAAWRALRQSVRARFAIRAQGLRFRRDPVAYLKRLEEEFLTSSLPV